MFKACPTLALFLLVPARGDISESFDAGWDDASYAGISNYSHAGVGEWRSQDALVSTDKARSGSCVRLRNAGSPFLEFSGADGNGIDGGITSVSFWHRHWDGDGSVIPFVLEYQIAGGEWIETASGTSSGTDYEFFSSQLPLVQDDIILRVRPIATPERLLIDDFSIATGEQADGPVISFAATTSTVSEGEGTVTIGVTISPPAVASVEVAAISGSATSPDDFTPATSTLEFTGENPTAFLHLSIVDDEVVESTETIGLHLANPTGGSLGSSVHTVTLEDNDAPAATGGKLVIMSANITSGNYQEYEGPGDRIFQTLKPDVIGIQEFSVPSGESLRSWVDRVFGAEFHLMVEAGDENIPCGVISRYPIKASGEWQDPQVNDRDFAWASIDLPGKKDLHVISVHFHGSGGNSSRNTEAEVIVEGVTNQFPADDYIVLTGDFNTTSRTEACVTTLKAIFTDKHVPTDQNGDSDTNRNRNAPYDWVMPNAALDALTVPFELGGQTFSGGLVYDTRLWSPTPAPSLASDSSATNMQHMAVVKAFALPATTTSRGTPIEWLESHGIMEDFENAELLDPDGDGFPTWEEFRSGTDPNDATSFIEIDRIVPDETGVAIHVSTHPQRRYLIEFADLRVPLAGKIPWTAFNDSAQGEFVETSATPTTHVFHDNFSVATTGGPPAASVRFYRVGVTVP